MLYPCKVTVQLPCVSQAERIQDVFSQQEVMSVEDESTSCYCLLDPFACHVLLDSFGTYALTGEPITDCAVKQLKVAVFGCMSCNSLDYNLRVYCVDNTPWAFQVSLFSSSSCGVMRTWGFLKIGVNRESDCEGQVWTMNPHHWLDGDYPSRSKISVTACPLMCWRSDEVLGAQEERRGKLTHSTVR